MRRLAIVAWVLAIGAATAGDAPRATGRLNGKLVTFPEAGTAAGAAAVIGLLESCHDESQYDAAELTAAQRGDHVRLMFARPMTATVLDKRVDASELILRLPLNTGVFWLRSGDAVRRFSKYDFPKERAVTDWLREARPAERRGTGPVW